MTRARAAWAACGYRNTVAHVALFSALFTFVTATHGGIGG